MKNLLRSPYRRVRWVGVAQGSLSPAKRISSAPSAATGARPYGCEPYDQLHADRGLHAQVLVKHVD